MIDATKLAAARTAVGTSDTEKSAGSLGKLLAAAGAIGGGALLGHGLDTPSKPPESSGKLPSFSPAAFSPAAFSPTEETQFARHGLNPERLKFIQTLSNLRQGMNLDRKLFEQALAGKLPAGVLGGGGETNEEADVESYA
jgi:hypothetical protein